MIINHMRLLLILSYNLDYFYSLRVMFYWIAIELNQFYKNILYIRIKVEELKEEINMKNTVINVTEENKYGKVVKEVMTLINDQVSNVDRLEDWIQEQFKALEGNEHTY